MRDPLIAEGAAEGLEVDTLVVGSGFGGAAVACRLAQAGRQVAVLEGGKHYPLGRGDVETTGHGARTIGEGHFQIDVGQGMNVIRGRGVGGGSLHYYGVRLRAPERVFAGPRWPAAISRAVLDPYYDLAGTMLAANPVAANPVIGLPARGAAFQRAARCCRRAAGEPENVPIAVYFGAEPRQTPSGVAQTRCVYCGECLLGCPGSASVDANVNARNLLTLNYLAVAAAHGARIFAEHFVWRLDKTADGFAAVVRISDPHSAAGHREATVRARHVVLAAGTLGSVEVLLRSRDGLGVTSDRLGLDFSGNGDFLIPKIVDTPQDLQPGGGPTITAGCDFSNPENGIYVEDLGLTPVSQSLLERLVETLHELEHHRMGLLGMGTDAGNGVLRLDDGRITLYWDGTASLPFYQQMEAVLRELAQQLGGRLELPRGYDPTTGTGLLTAHPLGGAIMADDPSRGVVDDLGRVFGVDGLWVADGAVVSSALVVNPSYTISALAERVAFWMLHGREMLDGDPETPAAR